MLAILGEMLVPDLVFNIFGSLPALVTLHKIGREWGIGRHFFLDCDVPYHSLRLAVNPEGGGRPPGKNCQLCIPVLY
jgi:hypothetical protein